MSPAMLSLNHNVALCPDCGSTLQAKGATYNGRDIEWLFFEGPPGSGCGCPYCDGQYGRQ